MGDHHFSETILADPFGHLRLFAEQVVRLFSQEPAVGTLRYVFARVALSGVHSRQF